MLYRVLLVWYQLGYTLSALVIAIINSQIFKRFRNILILFAASLFCFASCKKTTPLEFRPGDKGELEKVEFDNVIGGVNLQLNTGSYTNASGETFKVSLLNYYISNIKLQNADGTTYTVPRDSSYFLIKEENPSQLITLRDIPAGNYTGISFVLGVDSLKSTAPVQRTWST